jgi:hypothetical protein
MARLSLLAVAILALGAGCAHTPRDMNRLSVGMSKAQVYAVLGEPLSTGAQDGTQVLRYRLASSSWGSSSTEPYYVRLVDGKVESYGRLGDFDSVKDPTRRNNLANRTEASAR